MVYFLCPLLLLFTPSCYIPAAVEKLTSRTKTAALVAALVTTVAAVLLDYTLIYVAECPLLRYFSPHCLLFSWLEYSIDHQITRFFITNLLLLHLSCSYINVCEYVEPA